MDNAAQRVAALSSMESSQVVIWILKTVSIFQWTRQGQSHCLRYHARDKYGVEKLEFFNSTCFWNTTETFMVIQWMIDYKVSNKAWFLESALLEILSSLLRYFFNYVHILQTLNFRPVCSKSLYNQFFGRYRGPNPNAEEIPSKLNGISESCQTQSDQKNTQTQ